MASDEQKDNSHGFSLLEMMAVITQVQWRVDIEQSAIARSAFG
jgi:hypothetical protein